MKRIRRKRGPAPPKWPVRILRNGRSRNKWLSNILIKFYQMYSG